MTNDFRLTEQERSDLRCLVDAEGLKRLAEKAKLNTSTVIRLLAGVDVTRGTIALARAVLKAP